jgi:hypothetical protein
LKKRSEKFNVPVGYDLSYFATNPAQTDEAWALLYSTKSRPFDRPKTGKIAVKVINHCGDEVLKAFAV